MEFEDVKEKFEWEARRHAVAFGLPGWDVIGCDCDEDAKGLSFRANAEGLWFDCWYHLANDPSDDWSLEINDYGGGLFEEEDIVVELMSVNNEVDCDFYWPPSKKKEADSMVARLMRAAYLLGRPIDAFNVEFGLTLTVHEKLDLRLSLPRELWPQNWLDKDGTDSS